VRLTFGTSAIPPANVLRFALHVPQGGGTNNANMAQITTSGTVATLSVIYHTGGNLELVGKNAGGTQLFTSGSQAFGANGQPMLVSAELTQSYSAGHISTTAATVGWKLTAVIPGAAAVVKTSKGSVGGAQLGAVTGVNVNNAAGATDSTATGIGHVAVQYAVDPVLNVSQALAAYAGELAADRFTRLCAEQGVPAVVTGTPADTPQMGAQPAGLLAALLQDVENADLGQMFELRDAFGLGYITRAALQNQAPDIVLDYSLQQVAPGLAPVNDEQLIRNDIVATRAGGGTSFEAVQATGPLSVQDPPNGVGLYQYQVTPNLFADTQLSGFAAWLLILGTVDEYRYPLITLDLTRLAISDGPFAAAALLDIGSFVTIINAPAWLPPGPVNQLCSGFSETLNAWQWTITINAVPEDPYTAGVNDTLPAW